MKSSISRIGIGTVQFGVPYGINNRSGQVRYADVLGILELAAEHGVNFLDTARGYGESEAVLGRALDQTGLRDRFTLCTKLDLPDEYKELDRRALIKATTYSIEESRQALGADSLDVLLLHRPDYRTVGAGTVWERLLELRSQGVIQAIGVSAAWGPADLDPFFTDGTTKMMQIPFNAFDGRWQSAGVFDRTREHQVTVVNRSTFLQGLLLMSADEVATRLPSAREVHALWIRLCDEVGIEPKRLALAYVLSKPGIDCTIMGVDSKEQFAENLASCSKSGIDQEIVARIESSFADTPETIVNPSLWQKTPEATSS